MTDGTSTMVAPVIVIAAAPFIDSYARLSPAWPSFDSREVRDAFDSALGGGADGHVLARVRWLRERGDRSFGHRWRDRPSGRLARLRADGPDHGVRHRPRVGMSPEPGRLNRALGGQAVSGPRAARVHRVADRRSVPRRNRAVPD